MQNIAKFGLKICENIQFLVIYHTRFIVWSVVGIQLSKLIIANNIISNYSNISLIRPSTEPPVVTKPNSNHPEIMLNVNSSLENIENYIDEKYDEHLKQQIVKDVETAAKNSINNNTKNDIFSCFQSHIDTLLSEIYFLRVSDFCEIYHLKNII